MLTFSYFTVSKVGEREREGKEEEQHQNTNMFDGVPADQFYQFIASTRTSSSLPLSFPLHGTTTFPSFDLYNNQTLQSSHLLHPLHHHHSSSPPPPPPHTHKHDEQEKAEDNSCSSFNNISTNLELERERSISEPPDPWSNDEVLALLRIRSSMENWFPPHSTWEHVSRKLGELGFKRSGEKCKEKFEEESRYFNSNINYTKNYRFLTELEEQLYHAENTTSNELVVSHEKGQKMLEKANKEIEQDKLQDSRNETPQLVVAIPSHVGDEEINREVGVAKKSKSKKRKRQDRFEMLKGFCEGIVNKMIAQQQELHEKLLEDMLKREEENIAREEAWKKQEMERINKEIETREHEQIISGNRQATIIEFLKKFTFEGSQNYQCFGESNDEEEFLGVPKSSNLEAAPTNSSSAAMVLVQQNPSSCPSLNNPNVPTSLNETLALQNPTSTLDPNISKVPTSSTTQNPNSLINTQNNPLAPSSFLTKKSSPQNHNFGSSDDKDLGKRWPRDEVLALINLRSNLYNSGEDKEGAYKAPLWERISQGMLELGYKRSAKRCKEKWENINKYFRKTKDANKKRSLDSRTCPYFHQLSNLYKQGTLVVAPSDQGQQENRSSSLENHSTLPETRPRFSPQGVSSDANMHVADQAAGEKSMLPVPAFDFEF